MKKVEKLISIAKKKAYTRSKLNEREIYDRMTTEQLKELVDGNPTQERIKEIFSSVGGLHLLE